MSQKVPAQMFVELIKQGLWFATAWPIHNKGFKASRVVWDATLVNDALFLELTGQMIKLPSDVMRSQPWQLDICETYDCRQQTKGGHWDIVKAKRIMLRLINFHIQEERQKILKKRAQIRAGRQACTCPLRY